MSISRTLLYTAALLLAASVPGFALAQRVDSGPKAIKPDRLAHYWVLDNNSVVADVPNMARGIAAPTCAAVSFVIEADGSTSGVKVQKVEPEGQLRGIAENMGKNIRFHPSTTNMGRDRVFSWLIFPFNLPSDPEQRTAVMQPCAIDSIPLQNR